LLNLDFARTLAASTGSVGERHAPMIKAVATPGLKIRYANKEVMAQEKIMTGPRKYRTDFQCLQK
jgi:hypothetical protein